MPRYQKKPVEIEAIQFVVDDSRNNNAAEIVHWILGGGGRAHYETTELRGGRVVISTLEGPITASPGDWVIRGVKGEFYPCKPDIFAATYEPVSTPLSRPRMRRP